MKEIIILILALPVILFYKSDEYNGYSDNWYKDNW